MELEIAVQGSADAHNALIYGADRVELCQGLVALGGITPSYGLIKQTKTEIKNIGSNSGIFALIRPRDGDFCYSAKEKKIIEYDILTAIDLGCKGIVVGALKRHNSEFSIDLELMAFVQSLVQKSSAEITFHRAFDLLNPKNYKESIKQLNDLGVQRILTSGGAKSVKEGFKNIQEIVHIANDVSGVSAKIKIMAGGGLEIADIKELKQIGVDAVHFSAKKSIKQIVGPGGGQQVCFVTDVKKVKEARRQIDLA